MPAPVRLSVMEDRSCGGLHVGEGQTQGSPANDVCSMCSLCFDQETAVNSVKVEIGRCIRRCAGLQKMDAKVRAAGEI